MKRKSLVFAVLAAAVSAAAIATVSLAAGGGPSGGRAITMHLVEKGGSFHFVDNPPRVERRNEAPSQGDMFVISSGLFTKSGKRAGGLFASCVFASGGRNGVSVCTGTFRLAGGQLHLMASLRGESRVTNIAIVGGTRAYEGASGSIVSLSAGGNSDVSRDTVHLLLP